MHLTPREREKLMVVVAADLARRRQARGRELALEHELDGAGMQRSAARRKLRSSATATTY